MKEFSFREFKAYLNNVKTRDLTLDLDRTRKEEAIRIAERICKEFKVKVRVFRTRRNHYQVEACFSHSLLDNILIRLLCGDDLARLMFDVWRMNARNPNHNVLFVHKLKAVKGKIVLERKPRTLIYIARPEKYYRNRVHHRMPDGKEVIT